MMLDRGITNYCKGYTDEKKLYQTGIVSLLLLFAIVLLGCGTAKMGVYSSSLQQPDPDKLCNLRIHYSTGITGIDGKAVSWGIAREVKYTEISIPAGLHFRRHLVFIIRKVLQLTEEQKNFQNYLIIFL